MYAKLFTSIYQGTLRGNSAGLLVFTNLLAHCDKHGNADIHPRAIAEEVGLSLEQVKAALVMLESPDDESRSPEEQGRRIVRQDDHRDWGWNVVNYLKYRAIRDEDDRREQNRLAQERWRIKQRAGQESVSQGKPAAPAVDGDKPIQKQREKEKKTNTARKRAAAAQLVSVDDLMAEGVERQHAVDWLATRKVKALPLTPTAWADTKAEAAKAGITPGQAVAISAKHAWGGFRASWSTDKDSPNTKPASSSRIDIFAANER